MEHQWFQPGDCVRVRQWDDMEREYGGSVRLWLNVPLLFTRGMKQYCGQEFIVTEVWDISVAGERCQRVMGLPAQYQLSAGYYGMAQGRAAQEHGKFSTMSALVKDFSIELRSGCLPETTPVSSGLMIILIRWIRRNGIGVTEMFEYIYKSREREEALLRRFLRCIDDMKDYLDEYDECFGLACAPYDYEDCLCHVENFLSDRLSDVCDEMERLRG